MEKNQALQFVIGDIDSIDRLSQDAFLVLIKLNQKWYVQIAEGFGLRSITPAGGFQDESDARIAYQKALLEGELTPYRALAQRLGEVIELDLIGGYARVVVESNNAFFVFMVKPPYEVVSLCDDQVGMSEAEARELYNSFPDVLRLGPLLQLRQIPPTTWGTESAFVVGIMYVSATTKIADLEVPQDRIWIFAWRLADGEVRFPHPERLDEAMEVFVDFMQSNMRKVFERPNVFTPPAPGSAEQRE